MQRFHLCLVLGLMASVAAPAAFAGQLDTAQVRLWREDLVYLRTEMPARHANLFHTMTPAQFDSALGAIDQAIPRMARHQVIVELQKLAALVGDGHSNVSPWRDSTAAFHRLPVALYWFADGVYVRAAANAQKSYVGGRVIAIGGVPIDQAIERVRPLISRDNEMGVRAWAPVLLTMPEVLHSVGLASDPTGAEFTLEQRGVRRTARLTPIGLFPMLTGETDRTWEKRESWVDARDRTPDPLWLSNPGAKYWFRLLPAKGAVYCQLNAIQQDPKDSLRNFLGRVIRSADSARAERFILDLRLNGGGDGSWNRDILRALIKSSYDQPGHLFVISGRRTWSAAQMLLNELENWSDATYVGEPSASRGNVYGDSKKIVLPNSRLTVRVSSLYWQQSDPRDDRPFIDVNVPAPLTFGDYVEGRDPALEAAATAGK